MESRIGCTVIEFLVNQIVDQRNQLFGSHLKEPNYLLLPLMIPKYPQFHTQSMGVMMTHQMCIHLWSHLDTHSLDETIQSSVFTSLISSLRVLIQERSLLQVMLDGECLWFFPLYSSLSLPLFLFLSLEVFLFRFSSCESCHLVVVAGGKVLSLLITVQGQSSVRMFLFRT